MEKQLYQSLGIVAGTTALVTFIALFVKGPVTYGKDQGGIGEFWALCRSSLWMTSILLVSLLALLWAIYMYSSSN